VKSLITVVAATFLVIAGAGLLLSTLYAPTVSPARLVAFLATMCSVTGATVAAVVWIATRHLRP